MEPRDEVFEIDGHSYDAATLRWAREQGTWDRLKGPLGHSHKVERANDPAKRKAALVWLKER